MSNLGLYQTMTTVAKRVGGPLGLFSIVAGVGAAIGGSAVAVKNKVTQMHDENKKQEEEQ